jgi:hypothetical protein
MPGNLPESTSFAPTRSQGLVDVLDRILDKGLVIAGDVRVNLANVELLTIHVRLLICSIDKAEQIGLTWWKTDPMLSGDVSSAVLERENSELRERVHALETSVQRLTAATGAGASEAQESQGTARRSGSASKARRTRPDAE